MSKQHESMVDVHEMARLAIVGHTTPDNRTKFLQNLGRSGAQERTLLDAFLITMSAVATTDVEPPAQKALVNALIYRYQRGNTI